jgi:hypothetical protein
MDEKHDAEATQEPWLRKHYGTIIVMVMVLVLALAAWLNW